MEMSTVWLLHAALLAGVLYVALSLFNVPWQTRLRAIGAIACGVLILGVLGWPLVRPDDPLAPVTFFAGQIGISGGIATTLLAIIAGAVACVITYPHGKEIGMLAAPAGLAYWAIMGGSMRILLLTHSTLDQRLAVYSFLKWENLFWFLLVVAGGLGAWGVSGLLPARKQEEKPQELAKNNVGNGFIPIASAIVGIVFAAQFIIRLIAQNVQYNDVQLGSVIAQPGPLQIALAVFVAFLAASFLSCYFLNSGYIIAALSAPVLGFYIIQTSCSASVMEYMDKIWNITYYPNSLCAIMPIQLISFSAIGSMTGYWIAQRYKQAKAETPVP